LVETLRYKPEGRGFDSRRCCWIFFYWHNPCGRTMALESAQTLTKMSTRNVSWELMRPVHVSIVLKSGSLNLLEPSGPVQACNGIALHLHI
jgi:hypothetical protein